MMTVKNRQAKQTAILHVCVGAIRDPCGHAFECQSDVVDYDRFTLAKSYLDLQEYDRAAHFTKSCRSHRAYFIHVYARYLACEKRRVNNAVDAYGKSLVSNLLFFSATCLSHDDV